MYIIQVLYVRVEQFKDIQHKTRGLLKSFLYKYKWEEKGMNVFQSESFCQFLLPFK